MPVGAEHPISWTAKTRTQLAMLYLTRKIGESVIINGDIEVTVIEVRGRSVRLGFNFPSNASVLRREIFDRVQDENREAADAASVLEELTGPRALTPKKDDAPSK